MKELVGENVTLFMNIFTAKFDNKKYKQVKCTFDMDFIGHGDIQVRSQLKHDENVFTKPLIFPFRITEQIANHFETECLTIEVYGKCIK